MYHIRWTTLVLCTFCLGNVSAEEQSRPAVSDNKLQPVELKYRFIEGDEWYFSLTDKGTQTSISPSGTRSAANNSSQTKHYRVVKVDADGSASLEVILDRFRIDFTATDVQKNTHQILYDTDSDEAPPAGLKGVKTSIGKPFAQFQMSPSGVISDLVFPQAIQQNQLKQTEQRKGLPIAFPAEPISVGNSWSEKTQIELQLEPQLNPKLKKDFTVRTIYQLKSIDDGIAEITMSTIIQPRLPNAVLRGKMMPYLPKGTIRFDTRRGRILSRTEVIDSRELGVGGDKTALIIENKKQETLIDPSRQGLAN